MNQSKNTVKTINLLELITNLSYGAAGYGFCYVDNPVNTFLGLPCGTWTTFLVYVVFIQFVFLIKGFAQGFFRSHLKAQSLKKPLT